MTHAVANALAYNTAYQLFTRVYIDLHGLYLWLKQVYYTEPLHHYTGARAQAL